MSGLNANAIPRRKPRSEAVVEYYKFLPNETNLTAEESVRVNIQLALENVPGIKIKTVELIDKEIDNNFKPLSPIVLQVLQDLPLLQPEVLIFSQKALEIENITVENNELNNSINALLVIGEKLLSRPDVKQ